MTRKAHSSLFSPVHQAILIAVVVAYTVVFFLGIQAANDGVFTYILDDTYIHLTLADRIAHGHYGYNMGEFSAPSSSIIWPFILAIFAWLPGFLYVPLVLNVLAIAGTGIIAYRMLSLILAPDGAAPPDRHARNAAFAISLIFLISTNMLSLIFVGMEHGLQVLLGVVILYGMARYIREGYVSRMLYASLILLPLVRYESMALVFPALLVLFFWGERKAALLILGAIALTVGGFSIYLYSQSGYFLPSSIMMKGGVYYEDSGFKDMLLRMLDIFTSNEKKLLVLGIIVLLPVFTYQLLVKKNRRDAGLLFTALALLAGYFLWLGRGTGRYLTPGIAVAALAIVYAFRSGVRQIFSRSIIAGTALVFILTAVTMQNEYLFSRKLPLASTNIYDQHFQMHRFATEFYKKPVAANDIGYIGFRNPYYVLDVAGLANYTIVHERLPLTASKLDELVRLRDVHAALIYDNWYLDRPQHWVKLAAFTLRNRRTIVGGQEVSVYATDSTYIPEVQDAIDRCVQDMHPRRTLLPR